MSLKLRSSTEQFIIYDEKTSVIMQTLFVSLLAMVIGIIFVYYGIGQDYFTLIFGSVFAFAGFLGLKQLLKTYEKINRDNGFIHLKANEQGFLLAPLMGSAAFEYEWQDIEKIILARNLTSIDSEERDHSKNQIIFYFQPQKFDVTASFLQKIFKFNSRHVQDSPTKRYILAFIPFPKHQAETVTQELSRFAPETLNIAVYNTVTLNYKKKLETFES